MLMIMENPPNNNPSDPDADDSILAIAKARLREIEAREAVLFGTNGKEPGGVMPRGFAYRRDDTANSERFRDRYGLIARFIHLWGRWYIWNDKYWEHDQTGKIDRLAKQTVRAIYNEAADAPDTETAQQIAKHASKSGSASARAAMLRLAQSELPIATSHDKLNTNPYLVNVQNGTYNLKTNQLQPHDRGDLITYVLPVSYDPEAKCPLWEAFLYRIMDGNEKMIRYLQRLIGYSLSGLTVEQYLFFLFGNGANGKSVLIEILLALSGEMGIKTGVETVMQKSRDGGIPNDIAALAGKRVAVTSELPDNKRLNEAAVKDMTGGDRLTARFLHQEFFTFSPQFKLWMYGNHKPVITGTDDGIWRRIHLIPFNVQIPKNERDPHLSGKLQAELSGIFAWAIQGWRDYQENGLQPPDEVNAATDSYRAESDELGGFISDMCVVRPETSARASELYDAYTKWGGQTYQTQVQFAKAMGNRGFEKQKTRLGILYTGIGLLPNNQDRL